LHTHLAERRAAEAEICHAELEKLVVAANAAANNLTNRWGRFVENLVEPAAVRLFQERGIDVKETHKRMKVKRGELEMEIDIFVVDDHEAVAIEVKSHLTQEAVDEFLADLKQFKQAFPFYKNCQIYGAVAGIEIDENVDRYAYKKGLFVICQSGDTVEIANDLKFKPQSW
jgi:predicted RecB family endonuclease